MDPFGPNLRGSLFFFFPVILSLDLLRTMNTGRLQGDWPRTFLATLLSTFFMTGEITWRSGPSVLGLLGSSGSFQHLPLLLSRWSLPPPLPFLARLGQKVKNGSSNVFLLTFPRSPELSASRASFAFPSPAYSSSSSTLPPCHGGSSPLFFPWKRNSAYRLHRRHFFPSFTGSSHLFPCHCHLPGSGPRHMVG